MMLSLLALLAGQDAEAAARIAVEADAEVYVAINGHPYEPRAASYAILCDPGRNKVQVGQRITYVDVPNGHEIKLVYKGGVLTEQPSVKVEGLAETDYVDYYYDPDEDPANTNGGPLLDPVDLSGEAAALAAQGPGTLRLQAATEGDWYDVAVNGIAVAEIRNFFKASAELSMAPGPQRVEVYDASGRLVTAGALEVRPGRTMELRLSDAGLVVQGDAAAWKPE
ncbi:MAG: hypothetical protein H6740_10225 [Alphaproteobacteria bacterium]|nr:hypothetical protein [Alphaproteobacteria bacterium]